MKVRQCFVSNSSSSSFIVAYDSSLFGDLNQLFNKSYIGCSSVTSDLDEFLKRCVKDKTKWDDIKTTVEVKQQSGMSICLMNVDYEFMIILRILQQISCNANENQLTFIYND